MSPTTRDSDWTFFTNHAHVLLCIAQDPAARMRDISERVGITERAVQRIVAELEADGYLQKVRDGRRNRYAVELRLPLRHPIEGHQTVSALIALVARGALSRVRGQRRNQRQKQIPDAARSGLGRTRSVSRK
jgi:hypothetical protein